MSPLSLHQEPVMEDYPVTTETIAAAMAANREEREKAMREAPGLSFDADGRPVVNRPASVVPFLRQKDDASFVAPNRWDLLQTRESNQAAEIADCIAVVAYDRAYEQLPRREQANCRFLATHALRRTQDCWNIAARTAAIDAAVRWFRDESGASYRGLSEKHILSLAAAVSSTVLTAYFGISEGSKALEPGVYLDIVEGR